jgi:hypothetical protein
LTLPALTDSKIIAAWITVLVLAGCGEAFTSDTGHSSDSGAVLNNDSSTITPPAIPMDGLLLWLRSDQGVSSSNGSVSRWSDQSGHQFDAQQDQPGSCPKLLEAAIGGHTAVYFDGIDDFFQLPPGMADFSQGLSIFAVINESQPESYNSIVEFSNGSEIDDISFGEYYDELFYEVFDGQAQGGSFTYDVPQIVAVVHRADSTSVLRRNGVVAGAAVVTLPAIVSRQQNFVGQSLYGGSVTYPGAMAEVLVYGRALTDSEVTTVEGDLRRRWSCCD